MQHLRDSLPMPPDDTAGMLTSDKYGLTMKDAKTLAILDDGDRLDYYLDVVELLKQELSAEEMASNKVEKVAANWYVTTLSTAHSHVEITSFQILPFARLNRRIPSHLVPRHHSSLPHSTLLAHPNPRIGSSTNLAASSPTPPGPLHVFPPHNWHP